MFWWYGEEIKISINQNQIREIVQWSDKEFPETPCESYLAVIT